MLNHCVPKYCCRYAIVYFFTSKTFLSKQAELEAANVTWSFTDYAHTVHAFTLPSNTLWTSGPARPCL